MSNTDLILNTVEWNEIDWRKVELSVFKLQKRIYQASKTDNIRKLRRLQKTLLNSYHAKLLAVRRVTQDNQGKKTAGIDGVKSLTPKQRLKLVHIMKLDEKSKPVRRVWIPKSNGKERPLMNNWRFSCKMGEMEYTLPMHPETKITRHTKVKGEASPYDGNATYWASRMGKHPEVKASIARLLKKQKGKCNQCNLTFKPEDKIEKDHIIPRQAGGNKLTDNLQLLHKHCHDVKTKTDLIAIKRYKIKKVWERVYKRFHNQFDKTGWIWENDLPTIVRVVYSNKILD